MFNLFSKLGLPTAITLLLGSCLGGCASLRPQNTDTVDDKIKYLGAVVALSHQHNMPMCMTFAHSGSADLYQKTAIGIDGGFTFTGTLMSQGGELNATQNVGNLASVASGADVAVGN